jgi:hypothetical protein
LKSDLSFAPLDRLFAKKTERTRTFSSTYAPQAKMNSFSVIEQNMKMIHFSEGQTQQWKFFDVSKDPGEMHDLVRSDGSRLNSMNAQGLQKLLQDHRTYAEAIHNQHRPPDLNEEQNEMLKSLGYVQGNHQ